MSDDYLYEVDRYAKEPQRFAVARRTAKTVNIVVPMYGGQLYEKRVLVSEIGSRWFPTEREAWEALVQRHTAEVRRLQDRIQNARTQLGMAESRLRALWQEQG